MNDFNLCSHGKDPKTCDFACICTHECCHHDSYDGCLCVEANKQCTCQAFEDMGADDDPNNDGWEGNF